jgi:hypothetical protein
MTDGIQTPPVQVPDDAALGLDLPPISDEFMRERLSQTESYTLLLLKKTASYIRPDADPIVWEHGRRNMALAQAGLAAIICPVRDDSEWAGIVIFAAPPGQVREIMNEDPGVKAGIFTFEAHAASGFPGSALPDNGR